MSSTQNFICDKTVVEPEVDFIPAFKYGRQTGSSPISSNRLGRDEIPATIPLFFEVKAMLTFTDIGRHRKYEMVADKPCL
jgi:hypothetical protein